MLTLRDISFAASPNPAAARRLHELRMRDPFIFTDRERGLYFLYGTNTDVADGAANIDPYFDFYVSEDLETFYGPYMAFKPPKGYWGVKHYWAPEVHAYRGKYYMFASFKGGIGEDRGTAVLIADRPEGPFVPLSDGHVTLKGHECLDGTLLIDGGRPYIAFCHEWTELYYGKIKALGALSTHLLIHQPSYSMFNRWIEKPMEGVGSLQDVLRREGVGCICFAPLQNGLLTTKYLNGIPADSRAAHDPRYLKPSAITEEKLAKVRALNEIAIRRGQALSQMALAWVLRDEVVTSALIGASRPAQILENVKALDAAPFTDEEIAQIEAALAL